MRTNAFRIAAIALIVVLVPILGITWGDDGHKAINQAAIEKLPADVPQFFKAGSAQVVYEGPEPDRWRSNLEKPLNDAQAPDHFIDLEYVDWLSPLPPDRYSYIKAIYQYRASHPEAGDMMYPEKIGFQPYITIEVFDRLKVAFREYRHAKERGLPTATAEANALFYAGWLGHYVADGANPLHTTKHYNGWMGDNPKGYTTAHDIHSKTESAYVVANFDDLGFTEFVGKPKHLEHPFEDYIAYLRESQSLVEKMYQLEKDCGFEGKGTAETRDFMRHRLAAGATMLASMWYTAWVDSAQDPEPYHASREKKAKVCPPAAEKPAEVTK
jgi:hypothetical protein